MNLWDKIKESRMVIEKIDSGIVGTTEAAISVGKGIAGIRVYNVNSSIDKDILVSFDGGTKWQTIPYNGEREFLLDIDTVHIKGSEADVRYEIAYLQKI